MEPEDTKCGNLKFLLLYREWSPGVDSSIASSGTEMGGVCLRQSKIENQVILGDCNIHYWSDQGSSYQKRLDNLRESAWQNIAGNGWHQVIQEYTRFQSECEPTCLDHVYIRDTRDAVRVINVQDL